MYFGIPINQYSHILIPYMIWDYNDDHTCQTKILYCFLRSFCSYDVMLKCWRHSPDNRPSFEELSVILRQILEEQEVRIYG